MSHLVGATAVISATLQRGDTSTSWGFRLRGGADFNSAIVIERVISGSLADRCGLRAGDVIRAICSESTANMRHEDAHEAVLRAGNFLKLDLQRRTFDESCQSQEDDRATCSSATWSRSGAGSKAPYSSTTPMTEGSSSTLVESSYETSGGATGNKASADDVNAAAPPTTAATNRAAAYAQPWRGATKLYERERPKEIVAVVDEYKQHQENNSADAGGNEDETDGDKQETISVRPSVWCPPRRQAAQSRSFLMLQSMLDAGDEDVKIERSLSHAQIPAYMLRSGMKSESDVEANNQTSSMNDSLQQESDDVPDDAGPAVFTVVSSRPKSATSSSPSPFSYAPSSQRGQPRGQPSFPHTGRPTGPEHYGPPPVPVPRRSPAPRPISSLTSPMPHQPRAFRPGAAIRSAAVNPASRIPVCHRCSRNIRGPFVVALDKTFCPDHFNCDKCGCDMVDIGFVETPDGHIYCEDDYGRYMAPRCHRCRQAIIGTIVKALSAEWHTDCFTCAHCNKSIAGGLFHVEDGKPYCEKDYAEMFQTKCKGCDFPIEPGDRWVEAAGDNYHITCFNCTTCQCALAERGFVMRNGRPYCKTHARGL